jgi:hypothetical protein
MALNKPMFSVNEYDRDGDLNTKGVFLHFGETRVKVADSLAEFREIVERFESMVYEIEENYSGQV